jgi:hypothetical protein
MLRCVLAQNHGFAKPSRAEDNVKIAIEMRHIG